MPRLLKVERVMLDTLANSVLALDGVAGHVVPVSPGLRLLDAGELCHFCQSFRLGKIVRDGGAEDGAAWNRGL